MAKKRFPNAVGRIGNPSNTEPVVDAVRFAALDLDALRARVDQVLDEDLYWYPVRHHSPAIAGQIADCIRRRRPKVVFIEGPFEAQEMIDYLVDPKTRPPVAIYSSFRDDAAAPATERQGSGPPRYSAWYPLVSYSPELIAMQAAKDVGAKAVFMDLPHYAIERPDPASAAISPGASPPLRRPHRNTAAATSTKSR
jgi:hypothetical protein